MNKYRPDNLVRLKNGTVCRIVDYFEQTMGEDRPYVVEINGKRANFIVTDDMIQERIN